jgi:cytidylate kinase
MEAGMPAGRDTVLREIQERDHLDSTRPHGPLVRPVGAVVVDTGNRTRQQVVEELQRLSRAHFTEGFPP